MNSISLGKGTFPFVFAPMNLGWKHQKSYLLRRTTFDSFKFNFGFKCISKLYDCFLTRGLGARKAKTFLQTPATYEVAVSHHARSPWKKRAEFETYVFMMSSLRHLGSSNSSSFSSSPSLSTMNRFFWFDIMYPRNWDLQYILGWQHRGQQEKNLSTVPMRKWIQHQIHEVENNPDWWLS